MKKIIVIVMIMSLTLMFTACGEKMNIKKPIDVDTTQGNNTSEIVPKTSNGVESEKTSSTETTSEISIITTMEITNNELKQFLDIQRSEIIKSVGNIFETGSISVMESHMVFPYIYAEGLGLTFIFPNETDDFSPTYIAINMETNVQNINIKGAKPGMNFKEIIDKLGDLPIRKTWFSNENNLAYRIDFNMDEMTFSFVSYSEEGEDSQLYIYLDKVK